METSLKTGFAQVFSCCPKNLSCPNFGGAAAPLAPPGPYAYVCVTGLGAYIWSGLFSEFYGNLSNHRRTIRTVRGIVMSHATCKHLLCFVTPWPALQPAQAPPHSS